MGIVMVMMLAAVGCLGVLCGMCTAVLRWNELSYLKKGKLPPGTMGWPLFGETSDFLKQGPSFMKNRRARFGPFFKSHILGCPTIISVDPDTNRYILLNESKGLVPGYPQSMLDILGRKNIAAVHGSAHKFIRGALVSLVSPSNIREQLLPKIDEFMRSYLSGCCSASSTATPTVVVVDIQKITKKMAFLASLKQIAYPESDSIADNFMPEFSDFIHGVLSLPINLPGTSYRRGLQARKNILKILQSLLDQRKNNNKNYNSDLLGSLMMAAATEEENGRPKLTDEEIVDLIITQFYSGYETVSTTSMMAVKYLHDHPKALHHLREEHLAIRTNKNPEDPLNWDDLKSMKFTRAVIYETLRLATVVNGVLRKTTQDMEINGYLIPKGWRIYVYTREVNYDPCLYPNPQEFNPWRWLGTCKKGSESGGHFLVFGWGTRQCPGKELGLVEISTFLHYFITRYRWEEVGGDKLLKFPRVEAPNGLHIRVSAGNDEMMSARRDQ